MDTKAAFVFTGDGSLGAIQVGMLRALLSHGVQPDFVVGASVGALNATYFAGAPNIEGVAMLERIWCGLRRSDVFPISLASVIGLLRHPGNIADPGGLRRLIETHLPYTKLEDAPIPLNIMATSPEGLAVRLSSGPAAEAILASTAIPGVFPPVEIDGKMLMDGAVAANTPMRLAAELGASRIIVLSTGYACALKEPPKRAIGRALHALTLMINWQLMHEVEQLSDDLDVHIVPTLCPLAVSPFDFSQSKQLIERAAQSSDKWIEDGGLTRRASPKELSPHRHERHRL
jgi:NTE family protein